MECKDENQKLGKYLCFLETYRHTRRKDNCRADNLASHKEKHSRERELGVKRTILFSKDLVIASAQKEKSVLEH